MYKEHSLLNHVKNKRINLTKITCKPLSNKGSGNLYKGSDNLLCNIYSQTNKYPDRFLSRDKLPIIECKIELSSLLIIEYKFLF